MPSKVPSGISQSSHPSQAELKTITTRVATTSIACHFVSSHQGFKPGYPHPISTSDPPPMARQPPSTPSNASVTSASGFSYVHEGGSTSFWDPVAATTSHRRSLQSTPPSMASRDPHNTYLMPASPAKGRRGSADYRPSIKKALGNVPACLVNASVTYCGNDQIYAFGGFDQFTDEGQPVSSNDYALSALCHSHPCIA